MKKLKTIKKINNAEFALNKAVEIMQKPEGKGHEILYWLRRSKRFLNQVIKDFDGFLEENTKAKLKDMKTRAALVLKEAKAKGLIKITNY